MFTLQIAIHKLHRCNNNNNNQQQQKQMKDKRLWIIESAYFIEIRKQKKEEKGLE